jgi:hypothetical protein
MRTLIFILFSFTLSAQNYIVDCAKCERLTKLDCQRCTPLDLYNFSGVILKGVNSKDILLHYPVRTYYSKGNVTFIDVAGTVVNTHISKLLNMPSYTDLLELIKNCFCTGSYDYYDSSVDGVTGKIYVDTATAQIYVWNGSEYITSSGGGSSEEGSYYFNSFVERLKDLGSNVILTNAIGGSTFSSSLNSGLMQMTSIYVHKPMIVSGVGYMLATPGSYTASDYNGIGIYSFDKITKTYTLIASTPNDGNIWKVSSDTYFTKNLTTPVTLNKGTYFIAYLYNRSSFVNNPSLLALNPILGISTVHPNLLPYNIFMACIVFPSNPTLPNTIPHTNTASGTPAQIYLY